MNEENKIKSNQELIEELSKKNNQIGQYELLNRAHEFVNDLLKKDARSGVYIYLYELEKLIK